MTSCSLPYIANLLSGSYRQANSLRRQFDPIGSVAYVLFKDCAEILLPPLTKLMNLSLLEESVSVALPADYLKNSHTVSGLSFLSS